MPLKADDVVADKYRIVEVLGEGGMGTVFAAINTMTGKSVALKWLLPEVEQSEEHVQRLLREAKAAALVDHPNVVNVYDVGRHDASIFLVMEYLHGEPLSTLLAHGKQTPEAFIELMMPALRGVHAAHQVGIVHRDLKPDNIFLCRDATGQPREPKVLDFGISVISGERLEGKTRLTRDGTLIGTPHYMAPEQVRDPKGVDPRTDVYALGVIFYEAFSGGMPFDAVTLQALAIAIVEGAAQPLSERRPDLDPELCQVIMQAMACDLDERFQSVKAFARALEPWGLGTSFNSTNREWQPVEGAARRSSAPNYTPRTAKSASNRGRALGLAAFAVAILSLGFAGLALWAIEGMRDTEATEHSAPPDDLASGQAEPAPTAAPASSAPVPDVAEQAPLAEPTEVDGAAAQDDAVDEEATAETDRQAAMAATAAAEVARQQEAARRAAQQRERREQRQAQQARSRAAAEEPDTDSAGEKADEAAPKATPSAASKDAFETETNPYLRR